MLDSSPYVDLSHFRNDLTGYSPGAPKWKRVLWYFVNELVFRNRLFPFFSIKPIILRLFGAKVGKKVRIKWGLNIRFPWNLEIGNNVWLGENVWIDSITSILISDHVCISQGAYLLAGNHDYTSRSFDIIPGAIRIEEGVWIGAKAVVGPNVNCRSHSVLTAGSVALSDMDAFMIYQGNPAVIKRQRLLKNGK